MIVRITRGSGMTGLVTYLAGPGKRNEHSDPHLVAGDGAVLAWWDDAQLNRPAAAGVAAHLDEPRRVTGTEVAGGHVWHTSLTLPAADRRLSDEKWAAITAEFVAAMGFTDAGGRAPCRWAAVRHGVSAGGNDHVQVVVSLVRDDGTKADTWRDYARASAAAAELEVRYGLTVIESRSLGRGSAGSRVRSTTRPPGSASRNRPGPGWRGRCGRSRRRPGTRRGSWGRSGTRGCWSVPGTPPVGPRRWWGIRWRRGRWRGSRWFGSAGAGWTGT